MIIALDGSDFFEAMGYNLLLQKYISNEKQS